MGKSPEIIAAATNMAARGMAATALVVVLWVLVLLLLVLMQLQGINALENIVELNYYGICYSNELSSSPRDVFLKISK
ncbi:MAG: hypothetical protein M3247_00015 [Thermoproteota archaeon]|nr:hypothetical protein [Thermoproteota archaeon]